MTVTRTRTFSPRPRDIDRRWYVVDADGVVLGRLASEVAKILRGKHKPIFAPHMDTGDHVIVVNARGVRLTSGKETKKMMIRHSGYPGGLRRVDYERLLTERPATAVERAVRGMLPKNRLGRQMLRKLAVYEGAEHPHQAQKPSALGVGEIPRWEGLPTPPPPPAPKPQKPKPAAKAPEAKKAPRKTSRAAAAEEAPKPRATRASKASGAEEAPRSRSRTATPAKASDEAPAKAPDKASGKAQAKAPSKASAKAQEPASDQASGGQAKGRRRSRASRKKES